MGRRNSTKRQLDTLIEMHGYCRPMGSKTETDFIARYISNLRNAEQDQHGNWHVTVGDAPVLWSCHTDTVHHWEGMQTVYHNPKTGILSLAKIEKFSNCLGADDTAGVFLCREMILAEVEGHYVFHYGEERGGWGSSELAYGNPEFLRMFKFAIALDRQGHRDVITHQAGERCASDAFANSLAKELGGWYEPCAFGLYTDTAEYTQLIPECTNLSVGYSRAHSDGETLDTRHVFRLLKALTQLDVNNLVCERDPDAPLPSKPTATTRFYWDEKSQRLIEGTRPANSEYVYDDDRDFIRRDTPPDFLDAEVLEGPSLLQNELPDPMTEEAYWEKFDTETWQDYLNPVFGEVQEELRKQLKLRTTH